MVLNSYDKNEGVFKTLAILCRNHFPVVQEGVFYEIALSAVGNIALSADGMLTEG